MPTYPPEIADFVRALYPASARAHACEATNASELAAHQTKARPELSRLLGLDAIAEAASDHDVTVTRGETESFDGYTRTRCEMVTEPSFTLPFYLFLPAQAGPHPIAVLPHGHDRYGMDTYAGIAHDDDHREQIETEDRDVAIQAVKRGYLAIAPATRGTSIYGIPDVNDRHGKRDCRSQMMHALIAGRTATGERVWDMMRLIDWAAERDDTDASRVLVMGNSGGGVVTYFTAAVDERVTCAVPSCSFAPFTSVDGYVHHCDCNVVPGIGRFGEIWDVCALVAPRHLCIVNGRTDKLFAVDEVQRAVDSLRPVYAAAGCPDRFEHHFGPAGHRFYADLHWPFIDSSM